MGIDIYATWEGMTSSEVRAQRQACFSADEGHTGYLRESYHGGPYATKALVPEAFETGEACISAADLEKRLPEVLAIAESRQRMIYDEEDESEIQEICQSYRDFVALCTEKEGKTGIPCLIIASF